MSRGNGVAITNRGGVLVAGEDAFGGKRAERAVARGHRVIIAEAGGTLVAEGRVVHLAAFALEQA
jgi:hypothetical protein